MPKPLPAFATGGTRINRPPTGIKPMPNLQEAGFLVWQARHPGGTYPEYLVYWWLTVKQRYVEYADFWYQASFGGGRTIKGGLIADYLLTFTRPKRTWLEVYGVAYHTSPVHRGPESLAADIIRKKFAEKEKLQFIRCKDTDLLQRLDVTMRAAVNGHEIGDF